MPRAKGERRLEILKALAHMLEAPRWERITTAALAERLDVSEAALYRHFASKAQMYEGLIEFIESSVFTLANRITQEEADGLRQAGELIEMLLAFAEKNPGMVRVMTGDALVGEHERLQARMNQFFDRFEATLKQSLRVASDGDAQGRAGALLRYAIGCLHQYAKSGFTRRPNESFAAQKHYLLA
jgi:TetR/AcrR family transcriptional regulator